MKALKPVIILLFIFLSASNIFAQTSILYSYIPEDAKSIMKINPLRLTQKINWVQLMNLQMVQDQAKKSSETGDMLKNPAQTGIDLEQGIYLVSPASVSDKKEDPVIYGALKDTAKFAALVRKMGKDKHAQKLGGMELLINDNMAIAWNNDIFILTGKKKKSDTTTTVKRSPDALATATKQITEKCKTLLARRKTPLSNEHLSELLAEKGDILFWTNTSMPNSSKMKGKNSQIFGSINKTFAHKGDRTAGIINFENGKLVMDVKRYVSPSLDSMYRRYPEQNINIAPLAKLPKSQPIVIYSFSLSPDMMKEIFTKSGANKIIDSVAKKHVDLEGILSSIRGDATLAVVKAYEFTEEDSVTQAMNGLEVFVTGSIRDKEKFKQFSGLFPAGKGDSSQGKRSKKMNPSLVSNDSMFVLSISKFAAKKFLESPGDNQDIQKLMQPYQENGGVLLVDLKTVFGFVLQMSAKNKPQDQVKEASQALNMFDKLVVYGGKRGNRFLSSTLELKMTNEKENSLMQFISLLDTFYKMDKNKPKKDQSQPDEEKKQ